MWTHSPQKNQVSFIPFLIPEAASLGFSSCRRREFNSFILSCDYYCHIPAKYPFFRIIKEHLTLSLNTIQKPFLRNTANWLIMWEEEPADVRVWRFCREKNLNKIRLPRSAVFFSQSSLLLTWYLTQRSTAAQGVRGKCACYLLNEPLFPISPAKRMKPEGARLVIALGFLPVGNKAIMTSEHFASLSHFARQWAEVAAVSCNLRLLCVTTSARQ